MNNKQHQKQNIALAYSIASISLLCSLIVWTQAVSVSLHASITWQEQPLQEITYDSVIQDEVMENSIVEVVDNEPLHAAALPVEVEQVVVDVIEEPVSATEFDTWELHNAYSLSIPKIGVHTNVSLPSRTYWDAQEWTLLEEQMQIGLSAGAVAYPHSVRPGRRGNVIIAGHSSPPDARAASKGHGSLFERLPELDEGDIISVVAGKTFVDYKVTSIQIVSPTKTDILAQQNTASQLKLITCYPIGTTRDRWVVTAERVQ